MRACGAAIQGTPERPRLCVFRSLRHIHAQVIDDQKRHDAGLGQFARQGSAQDDQGRRQHRRAKVVGKAIAERARAAGIEKVVFDRGGYQYHGRVQALADAAREAGLKF